MWLLFPFFCFHWRKKKSHASPAPFGGMNPAWCAEVCSICAGKPSFLAVWAEHSSCPWEGENTGWVQTVYTGNFQRIWFGKMKILCWVSVQNLCLEEGDQELKGSTQTSLDTLQFCTCCSSLCFNLRAAKQERCPCGSAGGSCCFGAFSPSKANAVGEDGFVLSPLHCADVPALLRTLWGSFAPE